MSHVDTSLISRYISKYLATTNRWWSLTKYWKLSSLLPFLHVGKDYSSTAIHLSLQFI